MTLWRRKLFPALAGGLWLIFLLLDITNRADSTWVKFAAICLCCVTALLGAKPFDGKLVAAALCFTVGADWFLLVRDNNYELGIGLFIVVQLIYAYRLYCLRGKKICRWGVLLRLLGLIAVLVLWGCVILYFLYVSHCALAGIENDMAGSSLSVLASYLDYASLWSLFYFSNLAINTAEAFTLKKSTFACGLLLFVCCDICVGAWNLGLLPGFTRVGMWLFYLPSQVLIVLSQEVSS